MSFIEIRTVLSSLRTHPWVFLLLIVLQISLLVAAGYILLSYQLKIVAAMEGIIVPLQQANLDAQQLQAGAPFMSDFASMLQSYRELMRSILFLVLWLAGLIALGNGFLWALSHRMLEGKWKQALQAWGGYIITSLFFFSVVSFISYYWLRSVVQLESLEAFLPVMQRVAIISALAYVLLLLFVALADDWKAFLKRFKAVLVSFHKVIAVLLLNVVVISIPLYGLYRSLSSEAQLLVILPLSLTIVVLLVFTRLLWISSLHIIAGSENL